jgi:NAD(P)-dependent dehydrogenase (short-subunit alcohol dehydrogenase family)
MKYLPWVKRNIADMHGKTVVITGANSGIGYFAAQTLAFQGAHVIMACRSLERGEAALANIHQEVPNAELELMQYDQASFQSIEHFATELKSKHKRIDVLVLNAGIFHPHKKVKTAEGLPLTIGTNFIGMYYLLKKLIAFLDQGPEQTRVVFVGSIAGSVTQLNDPGFLANESGGAYKQYAQSKVAIAKLFHVLANGVNLYDFPERKHINFYLMHPGVTNTNIINSYPRGFRKVAHIALSAFTHSAEKAALGIVYAAGAPYVFNGAVYGPRGLFEISGFPHKTKLSRHIAHGSGQFIFDAGHLVEKIEKGGAQHA